MNLIKALKREDLNKDERFCNNKKQDEESNALVEILNIEISKNLKRMVNNF